MYVYGPSSLANYPASVWERRAFPSQPSVSKRGERQRQLRFLDIPGKSLFSFGGSGDSSSKVSHWIARVCRVYSRSGNWESCLLSVCVNVHVCGSVWVWRGCYKLAQHACKLSKSHVAHALLCLHLYELCGFFMVRYIAVCCWLDTTVYVMCDHHRTHSKASQLWNNLGMLGLFGSQIQLRQTCSCILSTWTWRPSPTTTSDFYKVIFLSLCSFGTWKVCFVLKVPC